MVSNHYLPGFNRAHRPSLLLFHLYFTQTRLPLHSILSCVQTLKHKASFCLFGHLLRRRDSNPRLGEYEPPELTAALPRNIDLPVGLEPTTISLQGRRSTNLSYGRIYPDSLVWFVEPQSLEL